MHTPVLPLSAVFLLSLVLTGTSALSFRTPDASAAGPRANELPEAFLEELVSVSALNGDCVVADDGSFVSADGGCKDLVTGLAWGPASSQPGAEPPQLNDWETAMVACDASLEGGFDDWFLPSRQQLAEVNANGGATHLNINGTAFGYWSSSTRGSLSAWCVLLGSGEEEALRKDSILVRICARIPTSSNPPAAPSDLTATAASSSRIDLSWADNSADEGGFDIERSTDGSNFSAITSVSANSTSHADTGLAASTTYWYRVSAFNGSGNSATSNVASATTSDSTGGSGMANGEFTLDGSVTSGSFVSTHFDDGANETLRERKTSGKPSNRVSLLEHKWTIDVQGGTDIMIQAQHSASEEDFEFAWSLTDGNDYVSIGTITAGGEQTLVHTFASPVSGTLFVRVMDTDRTPGNGTQDSIQVDLISVNMP